MLLAGALNERELALDETQSKELAKAMTDVAALYGAGVDPRALAWTNLALVAGSIYGPKALSIYARRKVEKEETRKQREANNVVNITP